VELSGKSPQNELQQDTRREYMRGNIMHDSVP